MDPKAMTQEEKIDAIYRSVEKTRKYMLWTLIITLVVIVLPVIALAVVLPLFVNTLNIGSLGL